MNSRILGPGRSSAGVGPRAYAEYIRSASNEVSAYAPDERVSSAYAHPLQSSSATPAVVPSCKPTTTLPYLRRFLPPSRRPARAPPGLRLVVRIAWHISVLQAIDVRVQPPLLKVS